MIDTDVLIIGGGPAGSTLARALTSAKKDVVLMDKAEFPRDKICAGWVTPAVMQELDIDLDEYAKGRVLQPIHGFRTGQIGQQAVLSDFPGEPASYGIRRIEFDHYLLQRCGAELVLGQPLDSMQRDSGGWIVNGSIKARLVVGAGGHFCPVARSLRNSKPRETAVVAKEIEFKMSPGQIADCPVSGEIPELFFTPDLKGYGWVFRKGDYLNIGLGREDSHKLSGHVDRFCDYLAKTGRIPGDLPGKLKGHAYLLYPHARRIPAGDAVILIGDAAGLAYAQRGEVIRPAVESALLAAQVIQSCRGDYRKENLKAYVSELEKHFGRRQTQPLPEEKKASPFRQHHALLLMNNRWFSRTMLNKQRFLLANEPPLPAFPNHVPK